MHSLVMLRSDCRQGPRSPLDNPLPNPGLPPKGSSCTEAVRNHCNVEDSLPWYPGRGLLEGRKPYQHRDEAHNRARRRSRKTTAKEAYRPLSNREDGIGTSNQTGHRCPQDLAIRKTPCPTMKCPARIRNRSHELVLTSSGEAIPQVLATWVDEIRTVVYS